MINMDSSKASHDKKKHQIHSRILRRIHNIQPFSSGVPVCCPRKNEVINLINGNQVVLISGETGCGKTTQIPQFILDDAITKEQGSLCNIVVTQPRRIVAMSVAERVAKERGEELGKSVGYQVIIHGSTLLSQHNV
ncbi:hypothetical protein QZH41_020199 [Actinostola sp. cb2023]|nr:hypothetical protein QZH41_020199 [Actinostola sp. cb2023]